MWRWKEGEGWYSAAIYGVQHNDFDFWIATFSFFLPCDDFRPFVVRASRPRPPATPAEDNCISAPCGWKQGAKWDHIRSDQVRVGSGEPSRGLFRFPAFCGLYTHKLIYLQHRELYWNEHVFSRPNGVRGKAETAISCRGRGLARKKKEVYQ